jgi:hypothetical protein
MESVKLPDLTEGVVQLPPSVMKAMKKPKFVPYEPYKGAVRPIVGEMGDSKRTKEFIPISIPPPMLRRKKTASASSSASGGSGIARTQSLNEKFDALALTGVDPSLSTVHNNEVTELRKELKIQQEVCI